MKIALGIDLAISEKETADYTAGSVLGRDPAGSLHVLDVQRMRAHSPSRSSSSGSLPPSGGLLWWA